MSNFDFINKAKQKAEANNVSYFVIYNDLSDQMKTLRSIKIYEPWDNINFTTAFIVPSLQGHIDIYQQFVDAKANGKPFYIEVDIGIEYTPDAPSIMFPYVNQALQNGPYASLYKSDKLVGRVITATTTNKFQVVLIKGTNMVTGHFKVLLVFDENGNPVKLPSEASVVHTNGGGDSANGGGYSTITLYGVMVCYGACPMRNGVVTVEPVPSKPPEESEE